MKKMLFGLAVLAYGGLTGNAFAQKLTENINRTIPFSGKNSNKVVYVENINGSVTVEGYNGNSVQLTAEKVITAKSPDKAEKGMKEFQVRTQESGDTIYVFLEAPFIHRYTQEQAGSRVKDFLHGMTMAGLGEKKVIHMDRHGEDEYEFNVNMQLKVPYQVMLDASTVNGGKVTITNTRGPVRASNVNGPLQLTNIEGTTKANTVNGDIDVTYTKNPTTDSNFRTINGKLNVVFKPNLSADFTFKTMHGEFYSDFDDLKTLPAQTIQNTKNKGSGTVYKVDNRQAMRLGKGGPTFSFETLNGNVYVRQGN